MLSTLNSQPRLFHWPPLFVSLATPFVSLATPVCFIGHPCLFHWRLLRASSVIGRTLLFHGACFSCDWLLPVVSFAIPFLCHGPLFLFNVHTPRCFIFVFLATPLFVSFTTPFSWLGHSLLFDVPLLFVSLPPPPLKFLFYFINAIGHYFLFNWPRPFCFIGHSTCLVCSFNQPLRIVPLASPFLFN